MSTASAARRFYDRMFGVGSATAVVAGMAAIDDGFRRILGRLFEGNVPFAFTMPDLRIHHIGRTVIDLVGLPAGSESPLLLFVVAAGVLFVLMFRS